MDQFLRLIFLQDGNTRTALLGATLLGISSATIGTFAVLRRRALVTDAVAHAALPGVCLAYLTVGDRNFAAFMLGALVLGLCAAAFIAFVKAATRIKEDATIAIAIGGFFGLGIVLSRIIQNQPSGNRAGLDTFIFGKAASMLESDARLIGIVAGAVTLAVILFYKELKLLCFDADFAAAQGWPTTLLDLALMAVICLCTIVGLPAVGVVLMVSLMVIPPVAARFWTHNLTFTIILAAFIGAVAGLLGTALSATLPAPAASLSRGWPTGPLITLVAAAVFIFSLLFAPQRGLIADLWRNLSLRRRIAQQNFLRTVYEALEPGGDLTKPWTPADLEPPTRSPRAHNPHLAQPNQHVHASIGRARRAGLITRSSIIPAYTLTPKGIIAAQQVVRAHRLWELFLIQHAAIAVDHVDRDADIIEHILPPATLAALEAKLAPHQRRLLGLPASPHFTPPSPIHSALVSTSLQSQTLPPPEAHL